MMAAHPKTAIEYILKNPEAEVRFIPTALKVSCWTEVLDFDDYHELYQWEQNDELTAERVREWAARVLPRYTKEWEALGQPATLEAWREARHKSIRAVLRSTRAEWFEAMKERD